VRVNLCKYLGTFAKYSNHIYLPKKMEQTEGFETSEYKLQTPGYYPKESIHYNIQNTTKAWNQESSEMWLLALSNQSVCPSAWNNSAPAGQIFMKFCI